MSYDIIIFSVIFAWLAVLSWTLFKTRSHYFKLVGGSRKHKIDEILEHLLTNDKNFSHEISAISKEIKSIAEQSKLSLQKIGITRFNPFERAAGEQSFVVALLNNNNSGLVINFIYTREGMRTYIKKVKSGKGEKYDLSEEEKEAVMKSNYY